MKLLFTHQQKGAVSAVVLMAISKLPAKAYKRLLVLLQVILLATTGSMAQVTLTTSPYTQTFAGTTTPTGWSVRTGATASALGTVATSPSALGSVSNTTGAFYIYPSLTTTNCLGIRQSGSFGDPGAAFLLTIANTTGKTGFSLSMNNMIVSQQTRTTVWTIQYSTNGGSAWTTVGSYTEPNNTTTSTTAGTYSFGTGLDNISSVVYIRIVALSASTGGGSRDSYGIDDVSLSFTSVTAPVVTTTTPANPIATTSATLAGNVSSDGGSTITGRGIVWSLTATNANPLIAGTGVTQVPLSGTTGAFSSSVTPLPVNTQVSFKAYAINTIGTSYGAVSAFYTLANVPGTPTVNTPTSSSLNVTLDANANPAVTQFAIMETTTGLYVQANGTLGASPVWQTATTWGTVTVAGLSPSTIYTFAAKARNNETPTQVETAFSSTASGTTVASSTPVITTGVLTAFGSVCLNTTTAPQTVGITGSTLDGTSIVVGPLDGYQFSTDGTTYGTTATITYAGSFITAVPVYIAFAPTMAQSYNGSIPVTGGGIVAAVSIAASGTGINTPPSLVTGIATSITNTSAMLADTIIDNGCSAVSFYGIEYSTTNNFTNGSGILLSGGALTSGAYAISLSGLLSHTTYYYHAVAANNGGFSYGPQKAFTTAHIASPVAVTATDTTYHAFTAHWTNVQGATGYLLHVYSVNGTLVPGNLASWTFPSNGATATPDAAPATSANNVAQTIFFSNGSTNTAPADITGNPGRAATFSSVWTNTTAYIEVTLNTTNFSSIKVSSQQYSSATGPKDFKLQYQIGAAGTWTDVPGGGSLIAGNAAWISSGTLSLPTACDNQPVVNLRWLRTSTTSASGGAIGSGGTSRIDNVLVTGQMGSSTTVYVTGYNPFVTTDTFATVPGLQPDSTYNYYVEAKDATDTSASSNTITVRTLPLPQIHLNGSPASYCTSSDVSINVAFTPVGLLTGTYNIQLSDATGHFPSNTTDNIVANGSASPLMATWPAGTYPAGSYKIRIFNDAPELFYGDSSIQFKISDPINVMSVPQPQSVCNGNAALLELGAANVAAVQWRMAGNPIPSANLYAYNAAVTGDYDVVVSALPGCTDTTIPAVTVTVATTPATTLAIDGAAETQTLTDGAAHIFTDATCQPIINIIDTTGGNTLGTTAATLTLDNSVQQFNGQSYLPRHADIHAASSGPATVVMYFLQSEFDAYNAMPDVTANQKLPANPTDLGNMGHLGFTLYHSAGTGGPNNAYDMSNIEHVSPGDVQLTWNGNYWEARFTTSGFSGFFASGGLFPLAITMKDISATNMGAFNRVHWTTATEQDGDVMQLERSHDGIAFKTIYTQPSTAKTGATYNYDDAQPLTGINYYRLRFISKNGDQAISKTVSAMAATGTTQLLVYPNPATNNVTLSLQGTKATTADIRIADFAGRTIQQSTIALTAGGTAALNINTLSSGTYIITCTVSGTTFQSVLEKK